MKYIKKMAVLLTFLLCGNMANGQNTANIPRAEIDIQYTIIQDSILINVIDSIVKYEELNDSLFAQGFGYFQVQYDPGIKHGDLMADGTRIDTVFKYGIHITYMHPDGSINSLGDMYPAFYGVISGRVVTVGKEPINSFFEFSNKSKQMYLSTLKNNLAPAGDPSLTLMRLGEVTYVYYLQNRLKGETLPYVVEKKYSINKRD